MFHTTFRHNTNLVLLLVIVTALSLFVGWIGYNAGLNAGQDRGAVRTEPYGLTEIEEGVGIDVFLTAISLAENAGLQDASGVAIIDDSGGRVQLDVVIPDGVSLPEGAVLEAWLVDAGLEGGLGTPSVSAQDERYGTPFANNDFITYVNNAPFAFSLGALIYDEAHGSYYLLTRTRNQLKPYDAVMVTIESDANTAERDPRPGTPILIGEIKRTAITE